MASAYPPLSERELKNTIVLFDVDKTLTPARGPVAPEMLALLSQLRQKVAIGTVGGSDLKKQQEQIGAPAGADVRDLFDFCFPENGLTAFRLGQPLPATSFIEWLGEDKYKRLVKWVLHYIADLDIPVKRGTFIEFRNGMINVSPIGRNASDAERNAYEAYDLAHGVRAKMVDLLRNEFAGWGLSFAIGGQISFDVFPDGWDKRFCLRHVEAEAQRGEGVEYTTIHFFGDKTFPGGNDYEIFEDPRTIGHTVLDETDALGKIREVFGL